VRCNLTAQIMSTGRLFDKRKARLSFIEFRAFLG